MNDMKSRELITILEKHSIADRDYYQDENLKNFLIEIDQEFCESRIQNKLLEQYKLIFDKVPCTISLIDENLNYVSVNDTLATLCGLKASEFVGRKVGFFTQNKYFFKYVRKLFLHEQEIVGEEIETTIQDGEKAFWVSGTIIPESGQALIIGIDITEVKNLEGRLEFTEKLTALGEMMASMIHDINNPLAVIHSCGHIIVKQPLTDEKRLKWGNKIIQTTSKISKIVNSIKTFVRNAHDDPHQIFDIHKVYEESLDICGPKLHNSDVEVIENLGKESFKVSGNETKLFQVMTNLISNSCDALVSNIETDKRWVKVSYRSAGDRNEILIEDSGTGIPKDIQDNIFKSFYTTKDVGVGSGLGLSTCKKILKEHDGDIWIDNNSPNTCFVVSLPKPPEEE